MKEICTLMVKLHIIFSRIQRVNQHARPSIIQVGCPTCCYQVCALDHANGGAADLDYGSEHCHRNALSELMMVILLTHIYVTQPQWVKTISGANEFTQNYPNTKQPSLTSDLWWFTGHCYLISLTFISSSSSSSLGCNLSQSCWLSSSVRPRIVM